MPFLHLLKVKCRLLPTFPLILLHLPLPNNHLLQQLFVTQIILREHPSSSPNFIVTTPFSSQVNQIPKARPPRCPQHTQQASRCTTGHARRSPNHSSRRSRAPESTATHGRRSAPRPPTIAESTNGGVALRNPDTLSTLIADPGRGLGLGLGGPSLSVSVSVSVSPQEHRHR
ncbi:hypothetical protein BDQ17DRAFT_530184 [Cyathus striatus]|nr:hypothetical protein BDQ17DRAFT_530184 [Cyathus striatus]